MSDLTIMELTPTPFCALSSQTPVREASAQTRTGEAVLVLGAADPRVLGVIPPGDLADLGEAPGNLADHPSLCHPPTFVLAETLVTGVLRAMRYDKRIRWLVMLQAGEPVRLVAPETLFALSRMEILVRGDAKLSAAVYGDSPVEPSGLCYLCSGDPAHTVPPERVEDRSADGQALCPCDGSPMVGTFVCPQEFMPC